MFDQIAGMILDGALPVGTVLPAERVLTQLLAVNRQALREALQRLSQLGLVDIRHGGSTRVRDYHRTAGLDLIPSLLARADDRQTRQTIRAVMEMRATIGADAAYWCAARASGETVRELRATVAELTRSTPADRPAADARFWDLVIDGCDNICYRLSLNSLRASYRRVEPLVDALLAPERAAGHLYDGVVEAVARHDREDARAQAAALLAHGMAAMSANFGHAARARPRNTGRGTPA